MSTHPGAPAGPAPDAPPAIGDAWEHREELVTYSRRLLGAHAELAEDVVQEAYLRLHECAARGVPVEEARPWLFRVARNLALDERRRGRRGDDVLSSLEVVSHGPRGPLEVLQEREEARQALEGLDALPPRERRTMILEQAGLAPPAIARRMHTTTNAVHQSLFRARRRMRDARAAALGLLPLPLVRLAVRATGSPALDRLPALAPGSGGRFGGGAGLAGLVAATAIGGGVVADRPVAPAPPVPASAAAPAPGVPAESARATPAAVAPAPTGATSVRVSVAVAGRVPLRAVAQAGVREAPARLADRSAAAAGGGSVPASPRERAGGDDDGTDDARREGRHPGGDERGERGERRTRGGGADRPYRGVRADRADEGGSDGDGRGRDRDDGGDAEDEKGGRAAAAAGGMPPARSAPEPAPDTGGAGSTPESSVGTPAAQDPVAQPPAAAAPGGEGPEPAPPASGPPPGDAAGPP